MKEFNPSIKHHLLIGIFISIWFFIFAFFIRPFDDGTLNFQLWVKISVGFSLIAFISYGLLSIVQKGIYQKVLKWNVSFEIISVVFFYLLYLVGTFIYYKNIIGGNYDFSQFLNKITLKTALISTPIILLARRYSNKLIPLKEDTITIRGESKLDILKIKKRDLVCISNSQNYVEIFFINDGQLKTKLIRSSLKKIQNDLDFLIQAHRSHLINPSHFRDWKNQNTIFLTQIEIPVSKNYKKNLLSL